MGTIAQIFLGRYKWCELCKETHDVTYSWIWGDKEHVKYFGDDVAGESKFSKGVRKSGKKSKQHVKG